MKYKVCVTKFTEHFEIIEIEAKDEREAQTKAIKELKGNEGQYRWTEAEKPRFRAEIVRD